MPNPLPADQWVLTEPDWSAVEPYARDLEARPLTSANAVAWMTDWARLRQQIEESVSRANVAMTVDTTDEAAKQRYFAWIEDVIPQMRAADQRLKEKLLAAGVEPEGTHIFLRNIRAEAALFREENLPLLTEQEKLTTEYDEIVGAQTVQWHGEERTVRQLLPVLQQTDRAQREAAWTASAARQLQDREALNESWVKLMRVRLQIAQNAQTSDFRAYRWRELLRFDYTPDDVASFRAAIEQVVVPAAERIYARRRARLGVPSLRPWDTEVDPLGRPPLRPFTTGADLEAKGAGVFARIDGEVAALYEIMRREGLLDLENRKGKAPGGYCTGFPVSHRPFIFMNSVGIHDDVDTLHHEMGHALHDYLNGNLPDHLYMDIPIEFCEVASMSMEMFAAPYLAAQDGGYYDDPADAARARIDHIEGMILFWAYMAVVDGFQDWVYTHHDEAADPLRCDAAWSALWDRFMRGQDWSGYEDAKATGWQRKLHIFEIPFYYVEYGLAQMGAVQVWQNAQTDPAGALAQYKHALSLGGTAALPDLFAAAGARFAFDAGTLGGLVSALEAEIERLEG